MPQHRRAERAFVVEGVRAVEEALDGGAQPALLLYEPGTLGTILRSAEAAGVAACWLTPDCVDLYNPKVVRAGAGVHFRLPCYPDQDWSAIRAALQTYHVAQIAALDARGPVPYYAVNWR